LNDKTEKEMEDNIFQFDEEMVEQSEKAMKQYKPGVYHLSHLELEKLAKLHSSYFMDEDNIPKRASKDYVMHNDNL
jgi:hypothetical protein